MRDLAAAILKRGAPRMVPSEAELFGPIPKHFTRVVSFGFVFAAIACTVMMRGVGRGGDGRL